MSEGHFIQGAWYSSFDPKAVSSISQVKDSNGYNLIINFQKSGATVFSWSDSDKTISKIRRPSMIVEVGATADLIPRYKKAFLNLFKQLNIKVNDGDIF